MRGKDYQKTGDEHVAGITPAYAGKRGCMCMNARKDRDHPRLCGEKPTAITHARAMPGSPPPMRGKVMQVLDKDNNIRITPAYAGKSNLPRGCRPASQDHPRLCGEKRFCVFLSTSRAGSPPPMRGKGGNDCHQEANARITPAYAGKRQTKQSHSWVCGDHPRLCGEKRNSAVKAFQKFRITPAYAGKSPICPRCRFWKKDHPRLCGEKIGFIKFHSTK